MFVDVGSARLWFDVDGLGVRSDGGEKHEPPCVILVHGGPGSFDHTYFTPEFGRLADVAQVVYLDLRGHGRSTWGDPQEWTLEQCADDVRTFCDVLGIQTPVVFGHSLGGAVVLLYAARHPGHAAGIVVQSGFARWDTARLAAAFSSLAGADVGELARRDFSGEELSEAESERVYAAFGRQVPGAAKRPAARNVALNRWGMDLVRRTDIRDQLELVTAPTLVCVGEQDPVTPVAAAAEIVTALPAGLGQLQVIPAAGHFTWLDAPQAFWRVLIDFVQAV